MAGFVFIATQPSGYSIKKNKEIAVSKDIVFDFVNNFETWSLWNPYLEKNAKESITKDFKTYEIRNGNDLISYTTLAVFGIDSIQQKISDQTNSHTLVWKFKKTAKGTLASCEMKGDLTLQQKIYAVLQGGVQNYMGEKLDDCLSNINKYLVNEIKNYNIKINGIVKQEASLIIKHADSSSLANYYAVAKEKLMNLQSFANSNQVTLLGEPFIIFDDWNETTNSTKFSVCYAVKEEIITNEGNPIIGGELWEQKAVKVTLKGNYTHIRKAWDEAFKFIEKYKLKIDETGSYVEKYIVSESTEKQPSKWITEVYIPIKTSTPRRRPSTSNSENSTSTESTEPSTPTVAPKPVEGE